MDSGFYAACSGLVAKTRQLESAAHNLANASTTAFKQEQVTFRSVLADAGNGLSQINRDINQYGVAGDPNLNLSTGTIERTGNELDLAIDGNGYFAIQTARGAAYTRNGHLQLSASNQLVTADGSAVLGDQGPISLPPGTKVSFGPDGTISANGALVGKLKLVSFSPDAKLTEVTPGNFLGDGVPLAANGALVRQGSLEASNVDGVEAAVGLIAIQRHAEMLQRALSIFHSEFNRIAAGELSRI
jgi:flagellar basal-body rod protein FlgF